MMPADPAISVVIPTRNRALMLRRALESVVEQDCDNYEVVVLDDGSNESVVAEYATFFGRLPERFQLHRLRPPGSAGAGPSAVRNEGIRRARGEFVAFLDDDDFWIRPDHLSAAIRHLAKSGADFLFANVLATRNDAVVIPNWFAGTNLLTAGRRIGDDPPVYEVSLGRFVRVMKQYQAHLDGWVVRRELLNKINGFWEKARFAEDYELLMRIGDAARRILFRADCVASYQLPTGNSISLSFSSLEQTTQWVLCTVHLQAACRQAAVRRCARARESWAFREIAEHLVSEGRPRAALPFAWKGVCTFPTAGGVWSATRLLMRAFRQLMLPGKTLSEN